MKAKAVVQICGTTNAWKGAAPSDPVAATRDREVMLEIQGDSKHGYHLIMSPEGCFTADSWHETIGEAKDTAQELFGIHPEAWYFSE
jgi:hypothetical protein